MPELSELFPKLSAAPELKPLEEYDDRMIMTARCVAWIAKEWNVDPKLLATAMRVVGVGGEGK